MRRFVITLALSASAVVPAAASAQAPARTVPTSLAGGEVLAKVDINGYKALMQVDTGATSSVIDSRIAKEIKLPEAGDPIKTQTIGCTASAQPVGISGWSVGSVPLPDLTIAAIRGTGKIPTYKKLPVIGLIGNDALQSFGVVGLDFADRRLVLGGPFPTTGRRLDADALVDKQTGDVALFTAKVTVSGQDVRFGIDTGAGTSVVEAKAAKQLKLRVSKRKLKVNAVACTTKVRPVIITGWSSGRVHLPTDIGISRDAGLTKIGLAGLIGEPILAYFGQVTFDYVNHDVALGFPPPAGSVPAPAPVDRSTRIAFAP